jgi:hypothetical protein
MGISGMSWDASKHEHVRTSQTKSGDIYQQNLEFYNRGFIVFDTHLWILVACISGLLPTHLTCQNVVSFICVYELVYKLVTCQPCVNISTMCQHVNQLALESWGA